MTSSRSNANEPTNARSHHRTTRPHLGAHRRHAADTAVGSVSSALVLQPGRHANRGRVSTRPLPTLRASRGGSREGSGRYAGHGAGCRAALPGMLVCHRSGRAALLSGEVRRTRLRDSRPEPGRRMRAPGGLEPSGVHASYGMPTFPVKIRWRAGQDRGLRPCSCRRLESNPASSPAVSCRASS